MKTKKILYVRNGPYKVNPSMYNLQEIGFCKALCNRGWDCDIIYYSNNNKTEEIYSFKQNRVNILWRKGYKVLRTGLYPSLLNKQFVNQYDLIITTEYSQIMSLLWTFFKPKVVLYNGPYYNLFKIPFTEKVYDFLFVKLINKRIEKVFTKSNLAKDYLEKKGFSNIVTIGVGLNLSNFSENINIQTNNTLSEIIGTLDNNINLLYVGSLIKRKNFPLTIKLFEEINRIRPDIKLVIVGDGDKRYIKKFLSTLDQDTLNCIIHIPKLENKYLKEIYKRSEVFLLPSKQEIFGMVLLEAMYFGAVPVSSLNGGSSTLIKNGENGFILESFNLENWIKSVLELINNNELRLELSNNAKRSIKSNFTWEEIVNSFLSEIEDSIKSK